LKLASINPKNGKLLKAYEPTSDHSIEQALNTAVTAFEAHRRSAFASRAKRMQRLAELLEADSARWGRLLTDEMGKTLSAAVGEVEKCGWVCRHYADNAEALLADEALASGSHARAVVAHLPLGPVLAVMPWNFPFWQVFRFAAPAVMAGNVVLLKHASNVPQAALALQSLFESAGFEPGVFQSLLAGPSIVERIIGDSRVKAATVTGSVKAGSSVASLAGKHLKKTVLELGGSDPFIVMPSADLERALDTAVTARILNNGQSCIAAKRFIVHADVFAEFAEGLVRRFAALVVGDPVADGTDVGPLAMDRVRARLDSQVASLLDRGAHRLTGVRSLEGPGYFFEPGVLAGIDADAAPFDEELFGPVAWLLEAKDFDAALTAANATRYGLGASIWTQERTEMDRAAREIQAGTTFVNSMVKSDPRYPFGGIGASGYGRELARDGIVEFVNRKTIVVD
jgi:succinate-semialdehyde dehydrogenase/glutarate-semialdehyde dehydrogenase